MNLRSTQPSVCNRYKNLENIFGPQELDLYVVSRDSPIEQLKAAEMST